MLMSIMQVKFTAKSLTDLSENFESQLTSAASWAIVVYYCHGVYQLHNMV